MTRPAPLVLAAAILALCAGARAQDGVAPIGRPPSGITPTSHTPLPASLSRYWIVPDSALSLPPGRRAGDSAAARFARGARLVDAGDFASGLDLVRGADLAFTPLADYSRYYVARALVGLHRFDEARAVLKSIDEEVEGYLAEAVPLLMAEAVQGRGDAEEEAAILETLSGARTLASPEEVQLRLARALEAAGSRERALAAYNRVYYEFPLSTQAADAQDGIERLQTPARIPPDRFRLELTRAERLFAAKRWAQARAALVSLSREAGGESDRALVALRTAECDYYLGRYRASREALRPYLHDPSLDAEARFFQLAATRALGDFDTYLTLARGLVADHPDSSWAEETLNHLASYYINQDDDEAADRAFRELARRFPKGRYTDRAAWKIGWWAYKGGRFGDAADTFEGASAAFPRADYRPSWLYWAARSRDRLGERAAANALYRIAAADYLNSYYGRLASAVLAGRREPPVSPIVAIEAAAGPAPGVLVPTEGVIRALLSVELYDAALDEVDYARRAWEDASPLQATAAWIRHRRGLQEGASARFTDVRGAITMMRRAYPQFMASGGEQLPPELLRVIFPLDYWPLIRKYAEAYDLDPYLMTALVAQESTFTADVRSGANAVGLMQLIPSTGRRYARRVGVRYSPRTLTQPETNIRLGMRYFKDLVDRFGGAHFALASYNAGESRVAQWRRERPDFEQDEFIDDIPFPETQNYVKRILGTADDYRRLYGGGVLSAADARR